MTAQSALTPLQALKSIHGAVECPEWALDLIKRVPDEMYNPHEPAATPEPDLATAVERAAALVHEATVAGNRVDYVERILIRALADLVRAAATSAPREATDATLYRGNSVSHWYAKACAYRDRVGEAYNNGYQRGLEQGRERDPTDAVIDIACGKQDDSAAFKNFHQQLCVRLGYLHDPKDWRRDQVSLIEHIAGELKHKADLITQLRHNAEDDEREAEQVMKDRDRAQEVLQETHLALGGDGEWAARVPTPHPPNSGDLHLDVPALAGVRMKQLAELDSEVLGLKRRNQHLNGVISNYQDDLKPLHRVRAWADYWTSIIPRNDAALAHMAFAKEVKDVLAGTTPIVEDQGDATGALDLLEQAYDRQTAKAALHRWVAAVSLHPSAVFFYLVTVMEEIAGVKFCYSDRDLRDAFDAIEGLQAAGYFADRPDDRAGSYWYMAGGHLIPGAREARAIYFADCLEAAKVLGTVLYHISIGNPA